jgi:hypothetical protein
MNLKNYTDSPKPRQSISPKAHLLCSWLIAQSEHQDIARRTALVSSYKVLCRLLLFVIPCSSLRQLMLKFLFNG